MEHRQWLWQLDVEPIPFSDLWVVSKVLGDFFFLIQMPLIWLFKINKEDSWMNFKFDLNYFVVLVVCEFFEKQPNSLWRRKIAYPLLKRLKVLGNYGQGTEKQSKRLKIWLRQFFGTKFVRNEHFVSICWNFISFSFFSFYKYFIFVS